MGLVSFIYFTFEGIKHEKICLESFILDVVNGILDRYLKLFLYENKVLAK